MELKTGYKQTEVGGIPEDWEIKALAIFQALTGEQVRAQLKALFGLTRSRTLAG